MIHAYIPHGWTDVQRYETMRQRLLGASAGPAPKARAKRRAKGDWKRLHPESEAMALLRFLDSYQREHGQMPTNSEIATQLYGWTAKSGGVSFRLSALEHGGWIVRKFGEPRGIKITPQGRAALEEVA